MTTSTDTKIDRASITGDSVTVTEGIVVRCTKCGNILFSMRAGTLKSTAVLQCPTCARQRVIRPAYMIIKSASKNPEAY